MIAQELFLSLAGDYSPDHDPYGDVMIVWFDVAHELWNRGEPVPSHWRFCCGSGGGKRPVSEHNAEALPSMTTAELSRVGDFCKRLASRISRAGRDY